MKTNFTLLKNEKIYKPVTGTLPDFTAGILSIRDKIKNNNLHIRNIQRKNVLPKAMVKQK